MKGPSLPAAAAATLDQALMVAARGTDGLIFLDLDLKEERVSWSDVEKMAQQTATGLMAAGVQPGDRVAIMLPTSVDFVSAFFGCLLAGVTPVPLYPPVRLGRMPEFIDNTVSMLQAVTARLVITESRLQNLLGQVAECARPSLGLTTLAGLDRDGQEQPSPTIAPHDLALIQFSSGTTRQPRPVALTHHSLISQCASLKLLLQPRDSSPQLGVCWLPLYHDMGLIGSLLSAVTYPGTLVLIRPEHFLARPALWLRAISRYRATLSSAPAFAFPYCARRISDSEVSGCDLSTWRLAICGAEHISTRALGRFSHRFAGIGFDAHALTPAYGLAEASLAVTCSPPGRGVLTADLNSQHLPADEAGVDPGRELVSCGSPLAGLEVEVRNSRGEALPDGHYGRIHVKGPTLMEGYFHQPEETNQVLCDDWLDTGDLGFLQRGELFVSGRVNDLIIIRGANHMPEVFEDSLLGVPGVRPGRTVAVGFQPKDSDSEELLMLVERGVEFPEDAKERLEQQIKRLVRLRTGIQPHTVAVLQPGTIPRTSSGKLRRQEARRRFLSGSLAPPGATHALAMAVHVLRSGLAFARLRFSK